MGKKSRRVRETSAVADGDLRTGAAAIGQQLCRSLLKEDAFEPAFMRCLSQAADSARCDDEESVFRAVLAHAKHEDLLSAVFSPRLINALEQYDEEDVDRVFEQMRLLEQEEEAAEELPLAFAEEGSSPALLAKLAAADEMVAASWKADLAEDLASASVDMSGCATSSLEKLLEPLLSSLEAPLTPDLRPLALGLFFHHAAASCVRTEQLNHASKGILPNASLHFQRTESLAARLAFFARGWWRSPGALWVRGNVAFMRGNMAEAVADLSAASRMADCVWEGNAMGQGVGGANPFRSLAHHRLLSARADSEAAPCMGLWAKVKQPKGQAPEQRMAAASCAADGTMYVFGGLAPDRFNGQDGYVSMLRAAFSPTELPEHKPKADLWALDIASGVWRCLEPKKGCDSPGARGYAVLIHYGGMLYLFGGRVRYFANDCLTDMWTYDLTTGAWNLVGGRHPAVIEPSGGGVHDGHWLILDPDDERLLRFDLRRRRWAPPVGQQGKQPMPLVESPACCWMWRGSLWIWGPLKGQEASVLPIPTLVEAKLSAAAATAEWHLYPFGLQEQRQFRGPACFPFCEGAAAVDETSGKAYIFGGWSDAFNSIMTNKTGGLVTNRGKYTRVLLEIDVSRSSIRAVEPVIGAADTKANLGPARRGHACVAAQGGRVVVCFGYTTYDECTGLPTMQPMRDTWTCQILSEQAAESFIPLRPDAPRSGAVRPNESLVMNLDFDDFRVMHQHARAHVLRDMELRKQLSNLCPSDNGQRGALLTVLLDGTGKALPPEKVYSPPLCAWVSEADLHRLLPGLSHIDPELTATIKEFNFEERILVLYIVYWGKLYTEHNILGSIDPQLVPEADRLSWNFKPAAEPAAEEPLSVFSDHFGRWRPNTTYINRVGGGFPSSGSIFSAQADLPTLPKAQQPHARLPVCANEACPATRDPELMKEQKLKKCSLCGLVRYCGSACQRADWPRHKLLCREVCGQGRGAVAPDV